MQNLDRPCATQCDVKLQWLQPNPVVSQVHKASAAHSSVGASPCFAWVSTMTWQKLDCLTEHFTQSISSIKATAPLKISSIFWATWRARGNCLIYFIYINTCTPVTPMYIHPLYSRKCQKKLRVTLGLSSLRCSPARLVLDYLQSAWILRVAFSRRFGRKTRCSTGCEKRAFWSYAHRAYSERQSFVEVWCFIQHQHLLNSKHLLAGQDWGPRSGMLRALATLLNHWGHDWEIFAFYQYWQGPLLWHFAAQRVLRHAATWQPILQTWGFPENSYGILT